MNERVDIGEHIIGICGALGLERTNVLRMEIMPETLWATVAKTNADGHKYVDEVTGEIAVDHLDFEVIT